MTATKEVNMNIEEIFEILDLMLSRAEIWEGPISKRIRLQLWERHDVVYQEWQ